MILVTKYKTKNYNMETTSNSYILNHILRIVAIKTPIILKALPCHIC